MKEGETLCCPEFNPKKYDNKKITWKKKLFIKDKTFSFFHIPLNFGGIVKKNIKKLKDTNALPKEPIILSDESGLFHTNIYISSNKAIPKAKDVKLSGIFLTKVFEGPYKNMKKWIKEMEEYVKKEKQQLKQIYFHYATCPECAKTYGKNYTVLFAEI